MAMAQHALTRRSKDEDHTIVDFPNVLHILWYRGASEGKQLALHPSNGVYKQYNCVPGAVITTI